MLQEEVMDNRNMETGSNTTGKPTIIKLLHRFHFFFLYVFLYSGFRNGLWFVDPMTETERTLISYMTIFGFIWFLGANFYLENYKLNEERLWPTMRKLVWTKADYLSPIVLIAAATVIGALELFVFDR